MTNRVRRRSVIVPWVALLVLAAARALAGVQSAGIAPQAAVAVEPGLDAVVRAFFATQEAEDADGYLALWSRTAKRPAATILKLVFDSGDDRYSEIVILRVGPVAAGTRVHVAATRDRTSRRFDGTTATAHSRDLWSLLLVREDGEWKIVSEGSAADDLASDLLAAPTAEAREALLSESPTLVTRQLVDAISRRATDLIRTKQYAAAQTVYERALEIAQRVGDRRVEGEMLQNLANTFYFQRNLPRALETYEQRLAIERDRHDPEAIAAALVGAGTIRYAVGEYAAALTQYREALALQELRPDQPAVATTLVNTGNVRFVLGDYPAAIADYRRSRGLYKELADSGGEAMALGGLGRVYVAQGDYAAAIEAFSGVLADGQARNDRPAQGSALMSLGDVHVRLGNLGAGRSAFEESRRHFEATADGANLGRAWQALAFVDLIAGAYATAEREYTTSAETCRRAEDRECVANAAVGLGFAQATQEKFTEAAASYTRAVEAFTALKRPELAARAQIGLSQAQTGLGRYADALESADRARGAAIALSLNDVLWRARIAEAQAHRKNGAPDRALEAARAALDAVDELREATRSQPGSPLSRDTSAAFATLVRLLAESGDAAGAFDTSERMRVNDLRAALAGNEREIARGMSPEEREEERAAAADVVSLRAQIARERGLPRPDTTRLADFERRLADAVRARAAQQERLFARLPDLAGWRGMFAPAAIADLPRMLGPGEVLLDFVIDDDALVALAAWVEEGRVTTVVKTSPLGRRALGEAVARMLQPATLKDADLWAKAIAPLADALPADALERAARAPRVFVVPHELLWRVPFEALPVVGGYLGARTSVNCLASLSARLQPVAPAADPGHRLAAIGAPSIAPAMTTHLAQTAPDWAVRPADAASRELAAVTAGREAADVVSLSGPAATKGAVLDALAQAGAIHLATPFRVSRGSVLFSPVLLAPPSTAAAAPERFDPTDATLGLRDVINATLTARVVVISDGAALAMRDAASDVGIVQWAWRAAGVPGLVLARWTTDEAAAETFLGELHRQLREGQTTGDAALKARQAVRRSAAWAAPYYWSNWMGIGQ